MGDIEGHIFDGNMNECLSNLGKLKNMLKNTYEMVDRLSNCKDELGRKINELEQEINNLKDELGGGEKWRLAENGLQYLSSNMVLTKEEKVCVENLKKLLEDIGMDIKLL
ncbi:unnamed protein product [Rhizophagus irregularis]|nr:unnamed protein product [Rhizophagus irregularis]